MVQDLRDRTGESAAARARKGVPVLLWAGMAALLLALGGYFYFQHRPQSAAPVLVTATRGDVEDLVSAVGVLQPHASVDVGAQVTGQLKTLFVKVGDQVSQGEPLAEIDSQVAAAKVDADNAQLNSLKAQLADKQASAALAMAQGSRQTHLKAAGATSQDSYDSAMAALKSARAQVAALAAQIAQAQSSLKADQAQLGYARIYAPMAGTVTAIAAKQGQTLNASQTAPTILTLSDLTTMTVNTQVSEADVPKLHLGMNVYFTTLGDRGKRYPATLRQILLTPTTVNNVVLYTALFDVPNPERLLLPQMTAQVFFVLAEVHDVVTLPVSAINFGDDGGRTRGPRPASVTVLLPSGTREERNVRVGISNRIDAQILSGLAPGEQVVAGSGS